MPIDEAQVALLKLSSRSFYDCQKIRIEMGNRLAMQRHQTNIRTWLDTKPKRETHRAFSAWAKSVGIEKPAPKLLFDRLMERKETLRIMSEAWRKKLEGRHADLEAVEARLLKDTATIIRDHPIWVGMLKDTKGIGPTMGGVTISEIRDISRFDTISKLWAYCGLHVIDGRAARRKRGEAANWNGFLKTKLLGVAGPSFLRCASPYREHYDHYKERLMHRPCSLPPEKHRRVLHDDQGLVAGHAANDNQDWVAGRSHTDNHDTLAGDTVAGQTLADNHRNDASRGIVGNQRMNAGHHLPGDQDTVARQRPRDNQVEAAGHSGSDTHPSTALLANGCTKGHMHNKAMRYMVKMFLRDLWLRWREIEGLPIRPSYQEEYLKHKHASQEG